MMSMEPIEEQTQPIKINEEPAWKEDDTSEIRTDQAHQGTSNEDIPGWLLEFAAQPEPKEEIQNQHGLESIEEPSPDPVGGETQIVLETAEWHEVQAELENPEADVIRIDISPELSLLLKQGDFEAAADYARQTATTKELAEATQRTLRSHLVLQEDRLPLWSVYDELSAIITQEDTQNLLNGG
jgi:hypothetical protein